jgi:hypothetical protein
MRLVLEVPCGLISSGNRIISTNETCSSSHKEGAKSRRTKRTLVRVSTVDTGRPSVPDVSRATTVIDCRGFSSGHNIPSPGQKLRTPTVCPPFPPRRRSPLEPCQPPGKGSHHCRQRAKVPNLRSIKRPIKKQRTWAIASAKCEPLVHDCLGLENGAWRAGRTAKLRGSRPANCDTAQQR